MFLAGIIMISIGVSLILNYGLFDSELLPPELRNDDGKKIIGIVLTTSGFAAAIISISVSTFYLCIQKKDPAVEPQLLTKIPASSRTTVTAPHSVRSVAEKKRPLALETSMVASSSSMHTNPIPINNRMRKKMKRRKLGLKNKIRLEGIQEDSLSRKQSEPDMSSLVEDTTRSDSSQEMTDCAKAGIDNPVFIIDGAENFPETLKVAESDVTRDNSSTESGYTDSVNTGSVDKDDFDEQVDALTQ